jgi:prolyl-tRNA synthetase
MGKKEQTLGITVSKNEDFVEWYNQVVMKAELADYAPIKGFMIIRPNGYVLWEGIQAYFNSVIQKMGVENAYFPLLIPESFFKKEADHAKGFAPELAWVEKKGDEERVAIRPTSETIMYDTYSKWIRSWKQLPMRINQWNNVLRWEVSQTKIFLRTREFLWQEGHCVYATEKECDREVSLILKEYKNLCEQLLAIPVLAGLKSKMETFAGAHYTLAIEALMPDGKALQMGTSHNLGQGFAKGFGISFIDQNEQQATPWQSSWGFSTRLLGAIIMVHGDDRGMVIPPRLARRKGVIVPIIFDKNKKVVLKKCNELSKKLEEWGVFLDDRDDRSAGWKFGEWELKGIPVRIEVGPKDIAKKQVVVVRRDTGKKEIVKEKELQKQLPLILEAMHKSMLAKGKKFIKENTVDVKNKEQFKKAVTDKKMAHGWFCGGVDCEEEIKAETRATSRVLQEEKKKGTCVYCGNKGQYTAYFARSY